MNITSQRFIGIDILRLFSIVAIVHFHAHETTFFLDHLAPGLTYSLNAVLEHYSRFMAFSGFTIIVLTFFLTGLSNSSEKQTLKLLALLWLGFLALALVEAEADQIFYFEWDIYPFLLVSFTVIFFLRHKPRFFLLVALLLTPLLFLPVWQWLEPTLSSDFLRAMLVGDCNKPGGGGWPILPWISLPVLFYSVGRHYTKSQHFRDFMSKLRPAEITIWVILLAFSIPWLGAFYPVPIGPGFNCFVHRRPSIELWSHLIWIIFFTRISLCSSINQWLGRQPWAIFIARMHWSRHFGVCYLLHFLWIACGTLLTPLFLKSPLAYDLMFISIFPATEFTSRIFFAIWRTFKRSAQR